jgi:hypothetical protein
MGDLVVVKENLLGNVSEPLQAHLSAIGFLPFGDRSRVMNASASAGRHSHG